MTAEKGGERIHFSVQSGPQGWGSVPSPDQAGTPLPTLASPSCTIRSLFQYVCNE